MHKAEMPMDRKFSIIRNNLSLFLFVIIVFFIAAFIISTVKVSAISDANSTVQKGLTVSPIKIEMNIMPGETKTGSLSISNFSKNSTTVNLNAEEFSVINPQYDYEFSTKSSVAKWVAFSNDEINLKAGESKTIKYSINVPISAEPGGQYLSIFSSTDTKSVDTSISSRQRIASLLYITVLGDIKQTGRLLSLNSPWFVSADSMWRMSLQNTGTAHFRSNYKLKITDIFGNDATKIQTGSPLILPGTIRDISALIPLPQVPGVYKLSYAISLGDSPSKYETKYMFYSPVWFSAILILTLSIVVAKIYQKRLS